MVDIFLRLKKILLIYKKDLSKKIFILKIFWYQKKFFIQKKNFYEKKIASKFILDQKWKYLKLIIYKRNLKTFKKKT